MRASTVLWLLAALLALGGGGVIVYTQTRGLRNNNPGNIRRDGTQWQGMADQQTDSEFVQFVSMAWGVRAMRKILESYRARGVVTLAQIINRWAPPSENNTQAYLSDVMDRTGLAANDVVSEADYPALIDAIARHENAGFAPDQSTIDAGVALA